MAVPGLVWLAYCKRQHEIPAHDGHLECAFDGTHGGEKLIDVAHALAVDGGDYIARAQAVTGGDAAVFNSHHQHAFDARQLRVAVIDVGDFKPGQLRHDL